MPGEIRMNCQFVDANGRQCRAKALKGGKHCFFHSREKKVREQRRQAQSQGGSQPKTKAALPALNFNFSDPRQIPQLASQLAELVYFGRLDRRRAETISRLAGRALGALEAGAFADELAQMKQVAEAEKSLPADLAASIEQSERAADDASFRRRVVELRRRLEQEQREAAANQSTEFDKNSEDREGAK
jgi:hypothetical protein